MADLEPVESKNLDMYGNAPVPWSRAHDLLANSGSADVLFFLGTVRPNGHPHSAGCYALWYDGDFFFVSGPNTLKSRNLATNPASTLSAKLEGFHAVLEGAAHRVTHAPTLEVAAKLYQDHGWPVNVEGDAITAPYNAPSAGPPPYYLYRFTFDTVVGLLNAKPEGAMRWRFKR